LTAHPNSETKDAMEDLWTMLSNTLKNMVLPLKTNTHTNPLLENVKFKEEISKSNLTLMLLLEMLINSLPLLPNNQFQLPLMLTTSNFMIQEFSLIAKPNLITELPLLDTLKMLGLSKTHGENLGEKMDTSDLREETPVGLPMLPLTQSYENREYFFYTISKNKSLT
jgi:hypothetical protein